MFHFYFKKSIFYTINNNELSYISYLYYLYRHKKIKNISEFDRIPKIFNFKFRIPIFLFSSKFAIPTFDIEL